MKFHVLSLWFLACVTCVSALTVDHWLPLPRPATGSQLASNRLTTASNSGDSSSPAQPDTMQAFHFLYGSCPCSKRIFRHLLKRVPSSDATEIVVLIDSDSASAHEVSRAGYQVDSLSLQELKTKYEVESAPMLVVTDSQGTILYSGGYTSRKQGLNILDTEILSQLVAGTQPEELPVFGCAISRRLQEIVDPLGFKYSTQGTQP